MKIYILKFQTSTVLNSSRAQLGTSLSYFRNLIRSQPILSPRFPIFSVKPSQETLINLIEHPFRLNPFHERSRKKKKQSSPNARPDQMIEFSRVTIQRVYSTSSRCRLRTPGPGEDSSIAVSIRGETRSRPREPGLESLITGTAGAPFCYAIVRLSKESL